MMKINVALREGGLWWNISYVNNELLKLILNSGYHNEEKICAIHIESTFGLNIIYDFVSKAWR